MLKKWGLLPFSSKLRFEFGIVILMLACWPFLSLGVDDEVTVTKGGEKMRKKCPFCKEVFLERKTIKETYTGHTIEVDQPGEFCNSCEEGILNAADMKATEKQILRLKFFITYRKTSAEEGFSVTD